MTAMNKTTAAIGVYVFLLRFGAITLYAALAAARDPVQGTMILNPGYPDDASSRSLFLIVQRLLIRAMKRQQVTRKSLKCKEKMSVSAFHSRVQACLKPPGCQARGIANSSGCLLERAWDRVSVARA